jgi:outer membrane immunogenic protein
MLCVVPLAAQAADMPLKGPPSYSKAPPPIMPPSYYSWSGFYVGMNVGYGFGKSRHDFEPIGTTTGNYDVSGVLAGATLGYNWQLGSFVIGAEADAAWSNIDGSASCPNPAFTCGTELRWLATARGRVGYAFDRWLPYLTAGGAYGNVRATIDPAAAFPGASDSRFGWTAGAGVEVAAFSNWTVKLEYLYVDLGSFDCGTGCTLAGSDNVSFKTHIARAGINYRF